MGGAPAAAGSLKCELGLHIVIESALPCDGTDPSITFGDVCVPITTETASGVIQNANLGGGTLPTSGPAVLNGVPGDCVNLQSGVTSGIEMRGTVGFLDSTLGDAFTSIRLDCQ
jgi:hypothetical protein